MAATPPPEESLNDNSPSAQEDLPQAQRQRQQQTATKPRRPRQQKPDFFQASQAPDKTSGALQRQNRRQRQRRQNAPSSSDTSVDESIRDTREEQPTTTLQGSNANWSLEQNPEKEDTGLKLRLDLNLDIEVELKAKIHGDITLALLS
ncbi:uncharacterized protein BO97DRAFT_477215 [Aspergillus homomorphus CBS 101889]|uniref:Uncharacterized protein n=1 Tax=Aspergillus homomorphus (strain CBS 101889) TaxID=1450537 RepID=A0A395I071_ASPHC|nr:hypothetical protein BO97DRAFT_477215 [Aspergillus homomorphus CBS 101889]RAL13327.1 hypothetical protein BO97DRAFT_477215 [Aspergillus homomorphus CBS 101889]